MAIATCFFMCFSLKLSTVNNFSGKLFNSWENHLIHLGLSVVLTKILKCLQTRIYQLNWSTNHHVFDINDLHLFFMWKTAGIVSFVSILWIADLLDCTDHENNLHFIYPNVLNFSFLSFRLPINSLEKEFHRSNILDPGNLKLFAAESMVPHNGLYCHRSVASIS